MKKIVIPSVILIALFLFSNFLRAGTSSEEVRQLASFEGIGISVNADVYYIQGNTHEIRIEGNESDVRDLITEVKDGFLQVKYENWRTHHSKLTLYITSKELESVKISGSADFMVDKPLSTEEMELGISGSGGVHFNKLETDEIEVKISGSGSVEIKEGMGDEIDVKLSGSGKLEAEGFEVSECDVAVSGSGSVWITVKDELDAKLSGSGKIYYRGTPRINSVASGSGKVVAL
jgi:hypothetical protein